MSKLETAFSKALKEQTSEQTSKQNRDAAEVQRQSAGSEKKEGNAVPLSVTSEKALARRTGLSNVVDSRSQIRQMAETRRMSDEELEARGIIHPRMQDARLLNIYRNLRTKLLSSGDGANFVTMVTSVNSSETSGLIAANIAASFAFDEGKTAILVEGDNHTPTVDKLFAFDDEAHGLIDHLETDGGSVADIIYESGIPRLRVVPSGETRENAAEYFSSERMKSTIDEITSRYPDRYPIVDAPSVQESADARILLDLCDQVVLVVPYGQCTEEEIRSAAETIGSAKLAGVVLDQF
jgi:protein-tyrosine kinase